MPSRTLLHIYPSFAVGGAQTRFVQIANHFGRRYRHLIVAMNGDVEAFGLLDAALDATVYPVAVRPGRTWDNLRLFRHILGTVRPDLLVTSNWGSIEWALANLDGRTRHLHMEDGFGPEETRRQLPRRVWTRRLALYRSTVMLPSQTLHHLARDIWRLPQRRLVNLPNGIDCARFAIAPDPEFAARLGIDPAIPVIGTVTSLRPEKNLPRLIEAFALVRQRRPVQLVLAGSGPERVGLEAMLTARGLSAVFTGPLAAPEQLLPSFDVFVLSSDTEQMPFAVLEAMAAGLPVVATDVGDVRNMVAPENQPLVTPLDAAALAGAIEVVLDDPDHGRAIGRANQERAREVYDRAAMFAGYRRLYDGE